jgi:hypothetical protein
MERTILQLFAAGAHRIIANLAAYARDLLTAAWIRLRAHFGWLTDADLPAVSSVVSQVQNAMRAGNMIGPRQTPLPLSYGINPAIPDNFQYSIIGYLHNPAEQDKPISIPWTVNNPTPLSYEEVLNRAEEELNSSFQRADTLQGAQYADLHRRDLLFQRIIDEQYGGHAPVDIIIREIYRRE